MLNTQATAIKRAQKEAFLYKELSFLYLRIANEDNELQGLFLNRVKLSASKSSCTLFFYIDGGEPAFKKIAGKLILYKPSLRAALAKIINARYTPELVFKYDAQFEKQRKIDDLLLKLKEEGKL